MSLPLMGRLPPSRRFPKRHLTVARHELLMQQGKLMLPEAYEGEFPTCLTLSSWARSQACQRLGIPAG